ncbi:PadR family transcriptional regulator [Amycolatopsis sp. NPDC059657]|uniref:PadR family transcriptional regulator n=1 Tax=Amycolatopsis sp. NPDC059657 TaxID=3346899 RepID=UPI003673255B
MRGRRHFPPPHVREAFGPFGRGGFGEFPAGWGPGPRGHGRGRGGPGRRGRRGDVRAAILALLAEQPRHGYEIIGEISERSGGFWKPSPGSIYPTLQLMADEGLVTSREDSGKRLFELTEEGRSAAEQQDAVPPWEHIAHEVDPVEVNLRKAGMTLMAAAVQVAQAGSPAQKAKAIEVMNEARRALYGILGASDDDESEAE